MKMNSYDLAALKSFSPDRLVRRELLVTEKAKSLLLCFESGQSVPSCVMEGHTIFYVHEGQGTVIADGVEFELTTGVVVFVQPGLAREIIAKSRLVVLAVQFA